MTIQKSLGKNLDDRQTLSVFTRGGVNIDHSYLRFDLASIQDDQQKIESAELLLTAAGGWEAGGGIRLYGVPDAPVQWPEHLLVWDDKAPSYDGMDNEPLLVEMNVEPTADDTIIRVSSGPLTKFIANSPQPTITLILAGSGQQNSNKRAEFYSKEKLKAAPLLRVQVPQTPSAPVDPEAETWAKSVAEVREALAAMKRLDSDRAEQIVKLIEDGKFDQAKDQVKELVERNPEDPNAATSDRVDEGSVRTSQRGDWTSGSAPTSVVGCEHFPQKPARGRSRSLLDHRGAGMNL